MPLAITAFAPNPGWPLNLGVHVFSEGPDGQLHHEIDGKLRAVVPPEGWADYAKSWPQCADLVAQLTLRPAADGSEKITSTEPAAAPIPAEAPAPAADSVAGGEPAV